MTTQTQPSHDWLSRETFSSLLEEYLLARSEKRRAKALLSRDDIKKCIDVLEKGQEAENYSAKLGYWVRNTFYIMNIGERSILHHTKTKKPVCPKEELYDKLCEFHLEVGHGGMNKTYDAVHYIILI